MKGIRWTKSNGSRFSYNNILSQYKAKIGSIKLWCRPSIKYLRGGKVCITGWTCYLYFEHIQIGHTTREKSLEFTQKEAEKLAIKYLLGYSLNAVKALKRIGLLEQVLSEVGIDL